VGLGHTLQGQRDWDMRNWDSFVIVFCMDCKCKDAKDCDVLWYLRWMRRDATCGDYVLLGHALDGVCYG